MEARSWLEQGATILWGQLREQVHEDEGTVNRLANRYAKALHKVLAEHRNMDADEIVFGGEFSPDIDVSNAAIRRVDQFKEDLVYIQGCRLEWDLQTAGIW